MSCFTCCFGIFNRPDSYRSDDESKDRVKNTRTANSNVSNNIF